MAEKSKSQKGATDTNVPVSTNLNPSDKRMKLGAYSLPSLKEISGMINEELDSTLRFPTASKVYKKMANDPNIASALNLTEAVIGKTNWRVAAPNNAPKEHAEIAEKLDYNLLVMDRPFAEYVSEALSFLVYGFHTPEKLYTNFKDLPVGDFIGWKDFRTISQDSVDKWIFNTSSGDLVGLRQDLTGVKQASRTLPTGKSVEVPRKKFMLFRHNPKRDNPEGTSPLRACYTTWKYRSVIEEYEAIFATKGLGGVLDLGIDVSYLAAAAADPSSDEASAVDALKTSAANFHNGDQAYTITPVAYDEKGKELFYTKILETKAPDTDEIIKRHDHRILQTFFADVLMLGSNGSGSFALSNDKTSLLMTGIEHILKTLQRTFNKELIEQTYKLNGWEYDARYAARFEYDDPEDGDISNFSAAVQRMLAVNALDRTTDLEDVCRDKLGLEPREFADTEVREVDEGQSRSGDGMSNGLNNGVGDSTSDGSDRAVDNKEGETT